MEAIRDESVNSDAVSKSLFSRDGDSDEPDSIEQHDLPEGIHDTSSLFHFDQLNILSLPNEAIEQSPRSDSSVRAVHG